MKPTKNRFAEEMERMKKDIQQQQRIPQPPLVGWYQLPAIEFNGSSSGRFDFLTINSGVTPAGRGINIGSKIRVIKSSVEYYFYVLAISGSVIRLLGPTAGRLPSGPYDAIYVSNTTDAQGFPYAFSLTGLSLSTFTGAGTVTSVQQGECIFSMIGAIINASYIFNFTTNSGQISELELENPFSFTTGTKLKFATGQAQGPVTTSFTVKDTGVGDIGLSYIGSVFNTTYWGGSASSFNNFYYDTSFFID